MDRWLYLQDTCGVHNLHGLPGVFSGLASVIAAGVAGGAVSYSDIRCVCVCVCVCVCMRVGADLGNRVGGSYMLED